MVESRDLKELRGALGRQLAHLRVEAGYTQEGLAPEIHYARSSIANVEVGRQQVPRAFWVRCGDVLDAQGQLVMAYDRLEQRRRVDRRRSQAAESSKSHSGLSQLPGEVRSAVLTVGKAHNRDKPVALAQLQTTVIQTHRAYQRAEYDAAADLVPALMGAASSVETTRRRDDWQHVNASIAAGHLAVSKLALKFGDPHLAWVAADRAHGRAAEAGDVALVNVTLVAIGCALLAVPGREPDAAAMIEDALTTISAPRATAELCALGALRLLAAVIVTREGDRAQAEKHLQAADGLADELGEDRNDLWTGFGHTNVLIHRVGIAAAEEPQRAIAIGESLDTSGLPPALRSRRSQLHLDLAAAFAHVSGGDASAVLHLLQVERYAPQLFRIYSPARSMVADLLDRERRAATPGLRDLATRTGVAA